MKILVFKAISVTQFYRYIGKYQWIFWYKISMRQKPIKIHWNVEKILRNDIKSNNKHFEVVLLKKLIYVWYNLLDSKIISCVNKK